MMGGDLTRSGPDDPSSTYPMRDQVSALKSVDKQISPYGCILHGHPADVADKSQGGTIDRASEPSSGTSINALPGETRSGSGVSPGDSAAQLPGANFCVLNHRAPRATARSRFRIPVFLRCER